LFLPSIIKSFFASICPFSGSAAALVSDAFLAFLCPFPHSPSTLYYTSLIPRRLPLGLRPFLETKGFKLHLIFCSSCFFVFPLISSLFSLSAGRLALSEKASFSPLYPFFLLPFLFFRDVLFVYISAVFFAYRSQSRDARIFFELLPGQHPVYFLPSLFFPVGFFCFWVMETPPLFFPPLCLGGGFVFCFSLNPARHQLFPIFGSLLAGYPLSSFCIVWSFVLPPHFCCHFSSTFSSKYECFLVDPLFGRSKVCRAMMRGWPHLRAPSEVDSSPPLCLSPPVQLSLTRRS